MPGPPSGTIQGRVPQCKHMFYTTGMCDGESKTDGSLDDLMGAIDAFLGGPPVEITPYELGAHLIRLEALDAQRGVAALVLLLPGGATTSSQRLRLPIGRQPATRPAWDAGPSPSHH
jgi:hypothetical protein